MNRLLRASSLVLALLLTSCGQSNLGSTDLWKTSTINKAKERGRLRVAMEPEFPPFESVKNGELVGFDVDLARILAQEAEIEVEFVQVSWDGIIGTLDTDRADLIISGMTATPLRALKVGYSDPYFHTVTCLLVSKERGADIKGIADLNREGRTVAVKLGTTGHEAAKKRCPKAEIIPYNKEVDAASMVASGRADAFLYDKKAVLIHAAKNPKTTFTLLEPVSVEPYCIACRQGDPETIAWLNLVLHHMRRDGRLEAMYAKYGIENAEPK